MCESDSFFEFSKQSLSDKVPPIPITFEIHYQSVLYV